MKRTENFKDNRKISTKVAISIYISIITFNVNRLNPLIRKHRVANWIKKKTKQNSSICSSERRTETESQGMEKDSNVNGNNKKGG